MIRMIDATELKTAFQPGEYVRTECVRATIDHMQTIDAIPVEWLEKKRKEALQEGMRPDEVDAVEMVIWMWQKEQESR